MYLCVQWVHVCMYLCRYVCSCDSVCVHICACMCVSMYVYVCSCDCWVVCVHMCTYLCQYVCLCVFMWLLGCVCVHMCMYLCVHGCICMCVSVCVYVRGRVQQWMTKVSHFRGQSCPSIWAVHHILRLVVFFSTSSLVLFINFLDIWTYTLPEVSQTCLQVWVLYSSSGLG